MMRYLDAQSQGKDDPKFSVKKRLTHEASVREFLASHGLNAEGDSFKRGKSGKPQLSMQEWNPLKNRPETKQEKEEKKKRLVKLLAGMTAVGLGSALVASKAKNWWKVTGDRVQQWEKTPERMNGVLNRVIGKDAITRRGQKAAENAIPSKWGAEDFYSELSHQLGKTGQRRVQQNSSSSNWGTEEFYSELMKKLQKSGFLK